MSKWKIVKVSDVCKSIFAGGDVPKNNYSIEKNEVFSIPIYTNGENNDGLYGYTTSARVTEPSITVSARGTIGFTAIRTIPFYPAIRLITLIPNNDIDIKYLYYVTQNYKFNNGGTSIPQLTVPMLKDYSFPLPPLETQHQIAATLDKVTHTIALCNAILEKLDLLVKARFVEMFGDMFLNPYKWEKEDFGTICDVRDGTHDSPKYYDVGYPLITSKNITGGIIDFSGCNLISKDDYMKINERSKVDLGDILMPMIGTIGKPVIVDIDNEFAIKNVALIKLRKPSKVINVFINALLQSDYFDISFINQIRGGTQKFISLGDIRKLQICVPPLTLQQQFAAFVEQTNKTKQQVKQTLEKAETLKKALMQEYFG